MVGSQAILGTFREDELPGQATMSSGIDILPIADSNEETTQLADRIEGVAGELSPFEQLHGFIGGQHLAGRSYRSWTSLSRIVSRLSPSAAMRSACSVICGGSAAHSSSTTAW